MDSKFWPAIAPVVFGDLNPRVILFISSVHLFVGFSDAIERIFSG